VSLVLVEVEEGTMVNLIREFKVSIFDNGQTILGQIDF